MSQPIEATSDAETPDVSRAARRASAVVAVLCWSMVVLEGYDLISFGSVLPVLIRTQGSGFTPQNAGYIGAMAFVGATAGALVSGWLSDRYGRRPVVIWAMIGFSVFTMLCGISDGPWQLGTLRLLAGIGIGAIVPATSALTLEYAGDRNRTLIYTLMLSGVPAGGIIAAISGLTIIPALGWRWVFFVAIIPAAVATPIVLRKLPESQIFLENVGRHEEAGRIRARFDLPPIPQSLEHQLAEGSHDTGEGLFSPRYRLASILFAAVSFFGLLTWFGLGTWLPGIMRELGYDLTSALAFLLVLNIGAILGSIVIAMATDRFGSKSVVVPTFAVLALALVLLINGWPQLPLMGLVVVAGIGGHGGQILVNRFVGRAYPPRLRAKALGWSLGAGRPGTILGPVVIGYVVAGGQPKLGFVFFAACALVAAILLTFVPRTPAMELEGQ